MKISIIAAIAVLSLSVASAKAQSMAYRAPDHNYYQNNWMSGH